MYDPFLWQRLRWGLADPSQHDIVASLNPNLELSVAIIRAQELQLRLLRRAKHFHRAIDQKAEVPDGLELFLVAGDGTQTVSQLGVDRNTGKISIANHGDGDGTVLRASALNDQRTSENWTPRVQATYRYSTSPVLAGKARTHYPRHDFQR